jgi:hypothetical protein
MWDAITLDIVSALMVMRLPAFGPKNEVVPTTFKISTHTQSGR